MDFYTSSYTFFGTELEFKTNHLPSHRNFDRIYRFFKSPRRSSEVKCSIEKRGEFFDIKAYSKRYSLEYSIYEKPHLDTYLSLFSPILYETKSHF